MIKFAPVLLLTLVGCGAEQGPERRSFANPLTGESEVMIVTQLNGWEATQFESDPRKAVMLAQSGRPVLSVRGVGSGRSIHVEGKTIGSDQVQLDLGADNSLERIEFFSDGVLYRLKRSDSAWQLEQHRR